MAVCNLYGQSGGGKAKMVRGQGTTTSSGGSYPTITYYLSFPIEGAVPSPDKISVFTGLLRLRFSNDTDQGYYVYQKEEQTGTTAVTIIHMTALYNSVDFATSTSTYQVFDNQIRVIVESRSGSLAPSITWSEGYLVYE